MEREVPIERNEELDRLVSEAEQGESVVLTRNGVAVATIVPKAAHREADRERALKAVADIERLSRGQSLAGLSIKDLINEGRKS